MNFSVQVFNAGTFWVPRPEVYWMEGWNSREPMNILIYLIRGSDHNILIITGLHKISESSTRYGSISSVFLKPRLFAPKTSCPKKNILRSQGLMPDDISTVLITPLQAYATANIPLFRKATIEISRRGWIEDFHAPFYDLHVPRDLRVPPDVNHYLQNGGWKKVRFLADEEEIEPGLSVF
jgi:hypothetical protein